MYVIYVYKVKKERNILKAIFVRFALNKIGKMEKES